MIKLQATSYKLPASPAGGQVSHSGFMALVTVVIIAAAALIMSLNSSLLGLGALDIGYLANSGNQTAAAAEGCLEEALGRLRVDPGYAGVPSPGLSVFGGSCIIEVTVLDANERRVAVTATRGDFTQTVSATVTLGSRSIIVNLWQLE